MAIVGFMALQHAMLPDRGLSAVGSPNEGVPAEEVPAEAGQVDEPCQVRLILFVPDDIEVPRDYRGRMNEVVDYAESFLLREFERWNHENIVMPFRRTENGDAEVLLVRGKHSVDGYKDATVRNEAIETAIREYDLAVERQVWWVMVYVGDPPKKFRVFRGGFDPRIGGWSVCNFNTLPGTIRDDDPLGEDFLAEINLKAMIHELGHGFQLPHIGPRTGDGAGNSLMGPVHNAYRRVVRPRDDRVYLSEAAAAMMSTHPAFRGVADERRSLPVPEIEDLSFQPVLDSPTLKVSGIVSAEVRPAYAIVADEYESLPGEYWTKTYVAPIQADGRFEVAVTEPGRGNGTLKLWFAFENGALTGNGKRRGKAGSVSKTYTYSSRRWVFN